MTTEGADKKNPPVADDRFSTIFLNAEELIKILASIESVLFSKVDFLVGNKPMNVEDPPAKEVVGVSWTSEVILKQENAMSICSSILQRLSSL